VRWRSYDHLVHRTRIKICGITRPEDAEAAARLGADSIGLVLHGESRRGISTEQARTIIAELPPFVTPVALFVDEEPQHVLDVAAELNVRHVQLQGGESPDEIAELRGVTVLKAIRVVRETLADHLAGWRAAIADLDLNQLAGFVLETAGTGKPGGSGIANDWQTILEHQAAGDFRGLPPIIAAGGLTPETVAKVVREIRPWAVDVSSGVEIAVGEKSEEKIARFIDAVRKADVQGSTKP
jgi:phosphoribosylanthranilate isomerase